LAIRRIALKTWPVTLWSVIVAEILTLLAFQASAILIPYYIQQMGITEATRVAAWTGAYQSVGGIAFAVFTPIWGAVGDRHGRKLMLIRAMGATTVVLAVMGLVRTPTQLMALRVVQGCLTGTPTAASALLATQSPKNRLAYALGLLQTALFIGMSLGPMLGGYIGDAFSYRATFFVSSAITAVGFGIMLVFVHEDPSLRAAQQASARRQSPLSAFRDVLRSRAIVSLVGLSLAGSLTFALLSPVIPLFIQDLVKNQNRLASIAGTVTGVAASAAAVSALVVGRLSDRVGHRKALLGCALGTALAYFPMGFVNSPFALGACQAFQGLFRGGIGPNVSAMAVESAPEDKTGTVLGLNSSASAVGFASGPLLGAAIMAATSKRAVFFVAGAMFLLISAVVARVGRGDAWPSSHPGACFSACDCRSDSAPSSYPKA